MKEPKDPKLKAQDEAYLVNLEKKAVEEKGCQHNSNSDICIECAVYYGLTTRNTKTF